MATMVEVESTGRGFGDRTNTSVSWPFGVTTGYHYLNPLLRST